ncbi:hypothetical protein KP509_05G036800 [Ceratopteris richardii]|uniref:ABC-2 type transporter transmembrane domain-containing protein n=1 Tax=Ceratopteris richardii TaxID=49495 RepID=A0A8T2UXM0_CERRI|nr:hypothetical protein KP509_05G036800 [Ceratopteris richardii]
MIAKIRHATQKEGDIITKDDGDKVSPMKQTFYLTARSFTNMRRDIAYYWFRLFIYIMLSICLGTIYYKVGLSYDAIQARAGMFLFVTAFLTFMGVASFPLFIEDMKIFTRERLNGHYGATVFVVANFLSAFPFVLLLACIQVLYEMGGLHPGFDHYICFIVSRPLHLLHCYIVSRGESTCSHFSCSTRFSYCNDCRIWCDRIFLTFYAKMETKNKVL